MIFKMSSVSQITEFKSLPSDEDLKTVAEELVSEPVTLGELYHPSSFSETEPSVRAVLVYRQGAEGAVRVTAPNSNDFSNVTTGPNEVGWAIITVDKVQTCMFYGNPTVRLFRALQSKS